jgi:hypothetical protein
VRRANSIAIPIMPQLTPPLQAHCNIFCLTWHLRQCQLASHAQRIACQNDIGETCHIRAPNRATKLELVAPQAIPATHDSAHPMLWRFEISRGVSQVNIALISVRAPLLDVARQLENPIRRAPLWECVYGNGRSFRTMGAPPSTGFVHMSLSIIRSRESPLGEAISRYEGTHGPVYRPAANSATPFGGRVPPVRRTVLKHSISEEARWVPA